MISVYRVTPIEPHFELRTYNPQIKVRLPYIDIIAEDKDSAQRGAELLGASPTSILKITLQQVY